MDREAQHAAIHGVTESDMTERLNLTELKYEMNHSELKRYEVNTKCVC